MENPPQNIDLDIFKNQSLLQVCIGAHELILNFEDNYSQRLSITVEGTIGVVRQNPEVKIGKETEVFEDFSLASAAICEFLNKSILESSYEPKGLLRLKFINGDLIEFYNDSEKYESYSIIYRGIRIVV